MKSHITSLVLAGIACIGLVGCGDNASRPTTELNPVDYDGTQFVLAEEPDGAVGVIAAKESVADGDPLVLVGRIGGSDNPWIEGRAAFTLMDPSVTVVGPGGNMADGEICMDDCCAAERLACTTLVKFVDENGQVVPVDSRRLLGVKASDMVVIQGTAKKDESGNFSLLATGLYVRN